MPCATKIGLASNLTNDNQNYTFIPVGLSSTHNG